MGQSDSCLTITRHPSHSCTLLPTYGKVQSTIASIDPIGPNLTVGVFEAIGHILDIGPIQAEG